MPGQELAVTAKKEKEVVVFIDGLFGGGVAGSARKALSARFPSARFVTLHCGAVSSGKSRWFCSNCVCVLLAAECDDFSSGQGSRMLLPAERRADRLLCNDALKKLH